MRRPARTALISRTVLHRVLLLGSVVGACTGAPAAQAQPATLRWKDAPLEQALLEFADAADVDLVFAHRLVAGRRVSGAWRPGEDPAAGLADLLEGTRLRAERIRTRQFVIIAEPLNVAVEPDDPAAYTGVLQGRIVDSETGLPLAGAHALLVDLGLGGVAGADGAFIVPGLPTGEYSVQFSHIGYRSVRVTVAVYPETSLLPPTIRLRPEPFSLGGATVRPRADPAPGAGATDLSPAAQRAAPRQAGAVPVDPGAGDLLRALEWLPGVSRAPGAGAGLAVRGFDPALLRTYRDGAPLLEPAHAAGLAGPFQPEALRGVRLHRGTPPAEVGGGLAGALEVEPHDGRGADRPAGLVALGPLTGRAVIAAPIGSWGGLAAAARHSALGWPLRGWPAAPVLHRSLDAMVLDPLGGSLRQGDEGVRSGYAFHDLEATGVWVTTQRQRLNLSGWLAGDRVDAAGPVTTRGRWRSSVASLRHRVLLGQTFLATTAYGSRYAADEVVEDTAGSRRDYLARLVEYGVRFEGDRYLSLAHTARAGIAVASRSLHARLEREEILGETRDDALETALWLQDAWRPAESWQVEAGVRAETFGKHRRISPRLLARWSAVPERLYVRAGAGRQTQGLHRLPDPGPAIPARASARWRLSDDNVRPSDSWQLGVGLEWAPLLGLAVSADAYARRSGNTLEPRLDAAGAGDAIEPEAIVARYAPVSGRAAGVEVAGRAEGGPWIIGVSYALARAETRTPPPVGGSSVGNWRRSRFDRPHMLGLLVQHEGAHWSVSARLDLRSRPPGVPAAVAQTTSLELAAGYRFEAVGARWDVQARAQPSALRGSPPVAAATPESSIGAVPLAFAADGATLPAWPVVSIRAAW